jgi:hypothetical protein
MIKALTTNKKKAMAEEYPNLRYSKACSYRYCT